MKMWNLITKLSLITVSLLISLNFPVQSHTWFNCVKLADPNDRNSACLGYPRGYVGWTPGFVMENHYMNKVLNHDLNAPVCAKAQSNKYFYNPNFPRAHVKAGETVSATYNSNGHVNFDKPLTASTHAFYWTGNPNQQITKMGELTPQNRLSSLQNYDDCVCGEAGYGPGVWFPKRGINGANVVCQAFFTIPPNTPSGIYQIVWRWTYDKHFNPPTTDNKEEYTQCFDIIVTGPDCQTPQDLPYEFTTTDLTNPDINGPTYPSFTTDSENGFTASGTPNYPKTVGTDIYPVGYVGTQAQAYGLKQAFYPNQQELCWDKSNGKIPFSPEGKVENNPITCPATGGSATITYFKQSESTTSTTPSTPSQNDNNNNSHGNNMKNENNQSSTGSTIPFNDFNQNNPINNVEDSTAFANMQVPNNSENGTGYTNTMNPSNTPSIQIPAIIISSTGPAEDSSRFGFDAINPNAQYIPQTFDTPPNQTSGNSNSNVDPFAGMFHPQCSIFEPVIQEPLSKLDTSLAPISQDLPSCKIQDLGSNIWVTSRPDYSGSQCNLTLSIGSDKVFAFALPKAVGSAGDSDFSIMIQYNASDFRAIVADLCLDDLSKCFAVGHQSVAPGQGVVNLTLLYYEQVPVSDNLVLSLWMTAQSAIMGADRPQKLRFDWHLYPFKTIEGYSIIQSDCVNITSNTVSNQTYSVARQFPIQVASNNPITMHIQYTAKNDSIIELSLCEKFNLTQCVSVSQKQVNSTIGSVVDLDLNIGQCKANTDYVWSLRTADAFNQSHILDWKLYNGRCGPSVEDLITDDCPLVSRQERCSDDLFIAKKLLQEIEPPPKQPQIIVPQIVVTNIPTAGIVQVVNNQENTIHVDQDDLNNTINLTSATDNNQSSNILSNFNETTAVPATNVSSQLSNDNDQSSTALNISSYSSIQSSTITLNPGVYIPSVQIDSAASSQTLDSSSVNQLQKTSTGKNSIEETENVAISSQYSLSTQNNSNSSQIEESSTASFLQSPDQSIVFTATSSIKNNVSQSDLATTVFTAAKNNDTSSSSAIEEIIQTSQQQLQSSTMDSESSSKSSFIMSTTNFSVNNNSSPSSSNQQFLTSSVVNVESLATSSNTIEEQSSTTSSSSRKLLSLSKKSSKYSQKIE